MTETETVKTPARIRVAQDGEGFWTCREARSGSQEYVRADIADDTLDVLKHLVRSVDDLIAESDGVYGLHLNGDLAPWNSLTEGGRFECWLIELERARAAIAKSEVRS